MSRLNVNSERLALIQGRQGMYYLVDGIKYDEHFPQEWALNHEAIYVNDEEAIFSGPSKCGNCRAFGTINGVFVGYCLNCVHYIYGENNRGGPLTRPIGESEEELWEHFPYMNGVQIYEIGDSEKPFKSSEQEMEDEKEEEEEEEAYDAEYDLEEEFAFQKQTKRFKRRNNRIQKEKMKEKRNKMMEQAQIEQISEDKRRHRISLRSNESYTSDIPDTEEPITASETKEETDTKADNLPIYYSEDRQNMWAYYIIMVLWLFVILAYILYNY